MSSITVDQICAEVDGPGDDVGNDLGESSSEVVVMVHGLGGTSNSFQAQMPMLSSYRVIRPDLPGSGRSPVPYQRPTVESYAADIGRICRSLGVDRAHFVGHSLGTLICQHIAAKQPHRVTSLTLFGPLLEPSDSARSRLRERAQKARNEGLVAVSKDIIDGQLSSDTKSRQPAVVSFVRESVMRQSAEGYALTCEALADAQAAELRLVDQPLLLITGDEDAVTPPASAEAIASKCRNAKVNILNRCGHWTPIERVEQCNALLRDFLSRHSTRRSTQ